MPSREASFQRSEEERGVRRKEEDQVRRGAASGVCERMEEKSESEGETVNSWLPPMRPAKGRGAREAEEEWWWR